jgi:hypothetical protein
MATWLSCAARGLANARQIGQVALRSQASQISVQLADILRRSPVSQYAVDLIAANGQHIGDLLEGLGYVSVVHSFDYTVQPAALKHAA